jgi:DNA-binding CsgD family transcriptional regulator
VADPIRVFIAGTSADERAALAQSVAANAHWTLVSDPAWADVVLVSPEEWKRLNPRPVLARSRAAPPVESLTAREFEVLRLVAEGLHNREIATALGVTEHTVKFHLGAIFGKLGATTRTEAVKRGLRLGVIEI